MTVTTLNILHWAIMSFPLGLFLNIEYHLNSLALFSLTNMLYLEATTERCSLKYVFFKTRET